MLVASKKAVDKLSRVGISGNRLLSLARQGESELKLAFQYLCP